MRQSWIALVTCFAFTMTCFALLVRRDIRQCSTQLLHLPHLRQYLYLCTGKRKVSSVMSLRCTIDDDVLGGRGVGPQCSTQLLHFPHLRQYLHLCTSTASKVSSEMSRRWTIDDDVLGGRGGSPRCCAQLLHLAHHTHSGLHRNCPHPHVKQWRVRLAHLY